MKNKSYIGVDVGGTKIGIGRVRDGIIEEELTLCTPVTESSDLVIRDIFNGIQQLITPDIEGIGMGVPGLVDEENGVVYGVQNIPSWKEVPLRRLISHQFQKPVYLTNDANCFVLGEKLYGKGRFYQNFVGLTLGTGLGTGIIINGNLYSGVLSLAGEIGGIPYKQYDFETYCSSKFFSVLYNLPGDEIYRMAANGSLQATNILAQFGKHLGHAIELIMYSFGPEAIFLGGSVSQSFEYFKESMWEVLDNFPHKIYTERLVIEVSEIKKVAILGAAALCQLQQATQTKKMMSF